MISKIQKQAEVQELTAQFEATETSTMSNVQVNNNEKSVENPEDLSQLEEKEFFKSLIEKQPTRELQVKVIDFLRTIWEYYDDNYSFPALGTSDKRVEFLQGVFLNPLLLAGDEVSMLIGHESMRERIWRNFANARLKNANSATDSEGDDSPPF